MEKKNELYNLWNRKEWKEKRTEFIKNKGGKCEWCGSTEKLTPAHKDIYFYFTLWKDKEGTEYSLPVSVIASEPIISRYSILKLIAEIHAKTNPDKIKNIMLVGDACPKCLHFSFAARKTLTPKFRCSRCGNCFDKPVEQVVKDSFGNERVRQNYLELMRNDPKMQEFIDVIISDITEAYRKYYMDFDKSCFLLCNKCHYRYHKGYDLCPKCKKNFKKRVFELCFDCLPQEKKKKVWRAKAEDKESQGNKKIYSQ